MAAFKMRTTKPEAGNKYYITKAKGGYSNAIQGKPTDPDCDVLANCVGYAYGRFNEIGGYGYCKYLSPVNAEKFMQYATGLKTGETPRVGACMVWRKGSTLSGDDGAGHVAIVEKVVSSTQVITSESGYGSSAYFWTQTRNKGSGNWGMGSAYTFLGFIYNPAVEEAETTAPEAEAKTAHNTSVPSEPLKFKVGDVVQFTGNTHFVHACALSGPTCKPGKVVITSIYKNGYHQYHVKGVIGGGSSANGWVDAQDLTVSGDSTETSGAATEKNVEQFSVGDTVRYTGNIHYVHANATAGPQCSGGEVRITAICEGAKHPYHVIAVSGGGSTAYGWVDAEFIEAI